MKSALVRAMETAVLLGQRLELFHDEGVQVRDLAVLEGVGHGRQRTGRLICIGVVSYMLGLSYRGVEQFLAMFGWRGSKSSICGVKTAYPTCGG